MQEITAGLAAFAIVAGWAVLRWQTRGRDPEYTDDPSVLLAAPPDGMTAATATIVDGGAARTAFLAALVDLASRGEISFRDETPDTTGAHRVGIEIHGQPVDDAQTARNRRRPTGEGEQWLLANLRGYAAAGAAGSAGSDRDERAVAVVGALSGFFGASAASGTGGESSLPDAEPRAMLDAVFAGAGKPVPEPLRQSIAKQAPMLALLREVALDPASVAADPHALATRIGAVTGQTPTDDDMASLSAWLTEHGPALKAIATERAGGSAQDTYLSADQAAAFHPPIGFGSLVENYARRNGWITGFSFVARWKWHGLAAVEMLIGVVLAGAASAAQGPVYGVGLGTAAGGLATWFIAPYMASRTREGSIMKAKLSAYRRTLKATFESMAIFNEASTVIGMNWVETPDQALVWGVALGLGPEIEALFRRSAAGRPDATAARAFVPHWIDNADPEARIGQGQQPPDVQPDLVGVLAGIERIGTSGEPLTNLISGT